LISLPPMVSIPKSLPQTQWPQASYTSTCFSATQTSHRNPKLNITKRKFIFLPEPPPPLIFLITVSHTPCCTIEAQKSTLTLSSLARSHLIRHQIMNTLHPSYLLNPMSSLSSGWGLEIEIGLCFHFFLFSLHFYLALPPTHTTPPHL
jgi:hypothetical protein